MAAVSVPLPGGPAGGPRTWGPGLPSIGVEVAAAVALGTARPWAAALSAEPALPRPLPSAHTVVLLNPIPGSGVALFGDGLVLGHLKYLW